MKLLFTALAFLLSVSITAQEQVITYPYNPDVDTDSLIAVPDMLDLLVLFGNEFIPEPVTVDGVVITEWLEQNSNSSGGGGCDYFWPDGLFGDPVHIDLTNSTYEVPSGKNLYLLSATKGGSPITTLKVNNLDHSELAITTFSHQNAESPLILKEGDVLSIGSTSGTLNYANAFGILIDAVIEPVHIDLINSTYEVPSGKNLYLLSAVKGGSPITTLKINNLDHSELAITTFSHQNAESPLILKEGDVLSIGSTSGTLNYANAFGYLADNDYFADCGGGGVGGSSEENGVNDQISNYNNILNESVTSGILNYLSASYPDSNSFSYTVPSGKLMKITATAFESVGSSNPTYINGVLWNTGMNLPSLLSEGTQIEIVFHEPDVFNGSPGDGVLIQYILFDN